MTTEADEPIRSVRALREAADLMEARGPHTEAAEDLNKALSEGAFADSDGQRLLALLLDAVQQFYPEP